MKITSLTLFSLLIAAPTFAATLTVPGSYNTIQACANAAQPGDVCLVSDGTYNETVRVARSGSSGSPITFRGQSGKPRVTGGFDLSGRSYVIVDGFELNGSVTCGSGCSFIQVLNNAFEGTSRSIQMHADDVIVSDNTFNNMSNDAVRQFGRRWVIRNNKVYDEVDSQNVHMDFWQSWCDPNSSSGTAASFALIENNEFVNVSGGNVHFTLINVTASCNHPTTNIIHRYNKVRNIGSLAIYVDNNEAAPGGRDNPIYNNTFVDLSMGNLASWHDYCCIMNASASSPGINNLFFDAADRTNVSGFAWGSGGTQSYNLYYNSGGSMAFSGLASNEVGAVKNLNPLLNGDFSLQSGSPAVDKGGPLTRVASSDGGSGTTLVVNEAEFFQPGWGGALPDTIAVGSVSNVVQIRSINYGSNTITLASSISRRSGDPVYLYRDSDGTDVLRGSAPDIGAVESGFTGSGGSSGAPTAPSNLRIVSQ
jgi:hypothetical protein